MKLKPLLLHEIGSLAKPSWRVKPFMNIPLNDEDIESADKFSKLLEIEGRCELLEILDKRVDFSESDKDKIIYNSSLYATKLLEKAGLDLVYDGEQHRIEMYEYPIRGVNGFEFKGHVRSFDNKYYRKASCVKSPELREIPHIVEYTTISSFVEKPVKVPITGAYTLVDWSYDEYYLRDILLGESGIRDKSKDAREIFFSDIAKKVVFPSVKALCDEGAQFIQIDEPAATTKKNEIPQFISSMKESIGDIKDEAFFIVHICFSDYSLLFPDIKDLEGIINEVHLEYANRDSRKEGIKKEQRFGYEILDELKDTDFIVGLGVLDVHTDFIEPPQLIRDRILYANKVIGDPNRIFVSPDCGLRTRTWEVVYEKLKNMVEGRNLAAVEMGLE